ncbi:MAG: LysR family transcriptional regulator, partial [Betaproteobacteria bacterium]|nr:LysR family transcriptional regulator [Betaproteobacteria bacterium]
PPYEHPLLKSIPLGEPQVTRRIGLIKRKGRQLSPEAQQLYDFVAARKPAVRAARSSAAADTGVAAPSPAPARRRAR